MNNNRYNNLPAHTNKKFEIIYSELLYDHITMFKNKKEKWGVLIATKQFGLFPAYNYLIPPIYNSIGFNKTLKLIEAVEYEDNVWNKDKNIYLYFDTQGTKVWQSNKGERTSIDQFGNIFLEKANNFGLLDKDFTTLIDAKYKRLTALNNDFFKASQNGKYGIINRNDDHILPFEFNEILEVVEKNKVMVKKDTNYFSFALEKKLLTPLPFSQILSPSSNTYQAPSAESFNLFKSITELKENADFEQYKYDKEYEMIAYNGKWGIINGAGEIIIPNEYAFVDFLRNPAYFKVGIGEFEVMDYEDEKEQCYSIAIKNVKWGIVDKNNNIIVPIEYDWIDEVEATIWVVYKGGIVFYNNEYKEDYWTIKNGKLGVYNLQKLITPIEYDVIKRNWFRIKEYIFVQNGTETRYFDDSSTDYDVFTLEGIKIETNKPKPKDYTYYG